MLPAIELQPKILKQKCASLKHELHAFWLTAGHEQHEQQRVLDSFAYSKNEASHVRV